MSVLPVGAVVAELPGASVVSSGPVEPFSQRLQAELATVDRKLVDAELGLQQLAAGKSDDLHHVMLSLEEARLSFQLLVQVRNKVLEAYQDVMRMQV
jgi:flagellar hook-basal body complex protein FliE